MGAASGRCVASGAGAVFWWGAVAWTPREMVDGKPKVEWEPKTNRWTGAEIQAVLKGAASLDGEWHEVDKASESDKAKYRFFKVVVELP